LLERENAATHVAFVDSDDWVSSDYLAELVRGLSEGAEIASVRCVRTSAELVAWETSTPAVWQTMTPRAFWLRADEPHSAAWGKLYAFGLFDGIRYPVGRINEDEFTTYRLYFRAERVACTEKALYAYYSRPDSIMNVPWSERRLDRLQAWRDQIRFFGERGFEDLIANSREGLILDLVEAIRQLQAAGNCVQAGELRQELSRELKTGRLTVRDHYLAHKTARPVRTRLMRAALGCLGIICK